MKKYQIIIIAFVSFFCFFISNDSVKASYASGVYIQKTPGDNENSETRTDLSKSNAQYTYYTYQTSSGIAAYCIDAHIQYRDNGTYKPALEDSHSKNFYEYYLSTSSKISPRGYILIGQFFNDKEKGKVVDGKTVDGGLFSDYSYVEMQIALRLWTYRHDSEFKYAQKVPASYSDQEYDFFVNAPNPSEPSVITKGLTPAQTLFNYAAREEDNPYTTNATDGFSYENKFWEARAKTVTSWDKYTYDEEPQEIKDENGNTKYKLNVMFKTNIRSGGINTYGDNGSCDDLIYVHDNKEEPASNYFYCNAVTANDEMFYGRDVNYIHIKTKDNVSLDTKNFYFKLKYKDAREPNNFWLVYLTEGYQRMYVTEENYGQLNLTIGESTPVCVGCECDNSCPKTENTKKICKPSVIKNLCSGSVTIKDDEDCIFGQNGQESTINTFVSDTTKSNAHTFTTEANEYCNISCAEEINFTFPKEIESVKAGTYFKFPLTNNSYINATGTRTCRATLDMNKFNTTVAKNSTDNSELNSIAKSIVNSKLEYQENTNYSYVQQNKALHQVYESISDSYSGSYVGTCNCDKDQNCDSKYKASVTILGIEFNSNTKCGNSSFDSSDLKYEGITLKKFKKNLSEGLSKTSSSITDALTKMNNCTTSFNKDKETNYDFAPKINYSYDEPYSKFFAQEYYNSSSATESSTKSTANFDDLKISYYDSSAILKESNYSALKEDINNAYIESKETKTISSYNSPLQFYTAIPTGAAIIKSGSNYIDYDNNVYTKYSKMEDDAYPIALKTKSGKYSYSFTMSNLGDYSLDESNDLGRIDRLLTKHEKIYYCTYKIENDVTTPDKPNFYYRNISLNNINPNNRNLGKNWSKDNEKAKATLCEIAGGKYNNGDCTSQANTSPESTYEKPEYSFTLTPENMQEIKKYNLEKEKDSNGYANFDMTKIDASTKDQNGNTLSEGVWFKSNFIWDTNTCQNCFTNKTNEKETTFSKWSDSAKLSGTGPAWK